MSIETELKEEGLIGFISKRNPNLDNGKKNNGPITMSDLVGEVRSFPKMTSSNAIRRQNNKSSIDSNNFDLIQTIKDAKPKKYEPKKTYNEDVKKQIDYLKHVIRTSIPSKLTGTETEDDLWIRQNALNRYIKAIKETEQKYDLFKEELQEFEAELAGLKHYYVEAMFEMRIKEQKRLTFQR